MRIRTIILAILLICCQILSAQNYYMQYTHDTLGNRTGRIRGVLTREMEAEGISADTTLRIIAFPDSVSQPFCFENTSQEGKEDDESSIKHGYLIKTKAEKEAFLRELVSITDTLKPIRKEGTRDISSYDVGAIPLQYGVSSAGARTYTVPIATAPDIKYPPSISLSYNSIGGYGSGGYGWSLGGISSIRLSGKSLYYDDVISAPRIDSISCAFVLDGTRLVVNDDSSTSSDYPLTTATGHVLAQPVYSSLGYIRGFHVLFPDGSKAEYHAIHNLDSGQNHVAEYPCISLENINGERIEFQHTYDSQSHVDRLTEIRYGISPGGVASGRLFFSYESDDNNPQQYYAGEAMGRARRIKRISSVSNGIDTVARYDLTYGLVDSTSVLKRISVSNGSGQLPPLEFEYSGDGPQVSDILYPSKVLSMLVYFDPGSIELFYERGKFLASYYNDGLLIFPNLLQYYRANQYRYRYYYPSDQRFLFAASVSDVTQVDTTLVSDAGFLTMNAVDTNGDGVDEIVKVNLGTTTSQGTTITIRVFKSNGSGQPQMTNYMNVSLPGAITLNSVASPYRRTFRWGDFNGDGRAELLVVTFNDNGLGVPQAPSVTLIDLKTGQKLFENDLFTIYPNEEKNLICIDIDSDGKTELCLASDFGTEVYAFEQNNIFVQKTTFYQLTTSVIASDSSYFADINADGYIDILKAPPSGSVWSLYTNTGMGFISGTIQIGPKSSDDVFFFMDLNKDGYSDAIKIHNGVIGYYLNRDGVRFKNYRNSGQTVVDSRGILPGNVVDYTSMSSLIKIDGAYIKEYAFAPNMQERRLLVQSTDSYGVIVRSEYQYLPMVSNLWTDHPTGINADEGFQLRVLPNYVLTNSKGFMSYDSGAPVFLQDTYTWYDGVANTRGLGFCGFSKTFNTSVLDGYYYRSINRFDPQRMGVPTTSDKKIGSPVSQSYSTVAYTWDSHSTTYGKLSPRLTKTVATDANTGVITTTTYSSYDAFDYPTKITTSRKIGSSGTSISDVSQITYSHSNSPSCYVLGTITEQSVVRNRMGERSVYTYDAAFRPLTKADYTVRITGPMTNPTVNYYLTGRQRWTYDSHGNVLTEESAPYNATQYTGNSYTYDVSGRHLSSSTNALGQTTTYSNFDKYGNARTVTDYRNRVKTNSFDSWGRQTKSIYADGTVDSTALAWGGQGVFTATHTVTGKPKTVTHYDALFRQTRSGNLRFNGQWQFTDTEYNQRGLVMRTSMPFRGTSPSYWNTCLYDSYGRRTRITEASGRVTNWYYSGTSVTETKDSISVKRTTNAAGELVSVLDVAGTITYTLRDDGQPSSITAPDEATTTFEYDNYGRRTSIVDPSAGTRSTAYTVNADGSSVTTETNALGSIATSVDKYGRITGITRTGTGAFNTTYTYDAYSRLSAISSTNSTGKEYTYDAYDRVSTEKETVPDSKWLQKAYTYGTGSNVASIAYSTQDGTITTEYYSYANGHNNVIVLAGGTTVLAKTAENDLGQPTAANSGSVSRTYEYTAYGFPTKRKLSAGGNTIQDLRATFNPQTGNLTSRSNAGNSSSTEYFYYDALGRLNYDNQGPGSYDVKGNVIYRSGVGTMTYTNTDHPYQLQRLNASVSSVTRPNNQTVTYTAYDRPATITESYALAAFTYSFDYQRTKMQTSVMGNVIQKKYYIGDRYEREENSSGTVTAERLFVGGDAYSAPMVLQRTSSSGIWTPYVIGRDYLGSITNIVTTSGTSVATYSYDPWGRMRDPQSLTPYSSTSQPSLLLGRGYCGHEHLSNYGLINMNARLYDPVLGRFLSPDPYVQAPDFSQNFNRYAYALNNPLKYLDPSGEIFGIDDALFWGVVAGAAIGAYMGGMLANNGQYNPNDWDYKSNTTWDHMIGGALVGGLSAYAGAVIAGSGIPFANTFSTMYSSFASSLGTAFYTRGKTHVTMSFGFASYDFTNWEWGYLGKNGNSKLDNLGYGLGSLANISDLLAGLHPGEVQLQTENLTDENSIDLIGHSQVLDMDGNSLIDFGPTPGRFYGFEKGRNNWVYSTQGIEQTKDIFGNIYKDGIVIKGVNTQRLLRISDRLNNNPGFYNFALRSCSSVAARSLALCGAPMYGLHPYLLRAQALFWSAGFRPWSYCYCL